MASEIGVDEAVRKVAITFAKVGRLRRVGCVRLLVITIGETFFHENTDTGHCVSLL